MKYCALIHYAETDPDVLPPDGTPERRAMQERYFSYGAEADAAGVVIGGDALHATSTATSVQVRNGKVITIDGPFAETKEQLGGFYLFDCNCFFDILPHFYNLDCFPADIRHIDCKSFFSSLCVLCSFEHISISIGDDVFQVLYVEGEVWWLRWC